MPPPKPKTQIERKGACRGVLDLVALQQRPLASGPVLDCLSVTRGLFNRIVREDQWDWFTVASELGYPSRGISQVIASELSNVRCALRDADDAGYTSARENLLRLPLRRCLSVFLGNARIASETGAGWIYILSTRELPDLLKIGMTTRTVEVRAQEINSATGVAIPFGVRRCWRVSDPQRAERLVHAAVIDFRLRNDREFFKVEFRVAAPLVATVIQGSGLEIRTLNALASLGE